MEYTIIVGTSWQNVKDAVNEKIASGWEPQGGVSITSEQNIVPNAGRYGELTIRFAQAMVRRTEANKDA